MQTKKTMIKKIIVILMLFGLLIPCVSMAAAGRDLLIQGANDAILGDGIQVNLDNLDDLDNHQSTVEPAAVPVKTFPQFIGGLIKVILGVLGVIFVILVIYAGSIWTFSMGDATKISKAKEMLIAGIIGIIIIIGSYIIVSFIISAFITASA